MSAESVLVYERKVPGEKALVYHIDRGYDPEVTVKLRQMLGYMNLSSHQYLMLLHQVFLARGTYQGPNNFSLSSDVKPEQTKEDLIQYLVQTPLGKVEVSDCTLHPAVVADNPQNDTGFHLRGGFEIFFGLENSATLSFPRIVEAVSSGVYAASVDRDNVTIEPGVVALIPGPTASHWTKLEDGFRFRYICLPPWSTENVRSALTNPDLSLNNLEVSSPE